MLSRITPVVFYRDPIAAMHFLEDAFGFETSVLVTDKDGRVGHAEMTVGEVVIGIGAEWSSPELIGPAAMRSPASLGGAGTQFIRVHMSDSIDVHCERARKGGARITQEPADQFYGSRTYRALDPEGHVWNFDQVVAEVSVEEMQKASELTFHDKL
ncbi:MAG TPA: VOC family protein [Caulobacteraceae bacterium]|nr:VOC family protein [Caulobacteraceae bacterium]